ncbi:MAG: SIS domain-containing protein [Fimbriimonadaceae bacterium]|nr:SIS domain-containing protein [Fimbriimonadaceae bacterium]
MHGRLMEAEMREQPARLAEGAPRYHAVLEKALGGESFDMVLLVARGSSDNAALYARYLIEVHLGIPVSLAAPSVWTRYGATVRFPKCLCIGVSQSGMAPDVAEVLRRVREAGHETLAITNTPASLLTEVARHTLCLGVEEERSIAATKTYTASLLSLYQLVRVLGGKLPSPLLPDDAWVERTREAAERSLGYLLRSQTLFALARGYGFATAQETALKLMECALLACKSYSIADFQHGPRALAGFGSAAIVYGPYADGLMELGSAVVVAPDAQAGPCDPIWEILFGQWLALHAARARALDPDEAQHLQKVTQTL